MCSLRAILGFVHGPWAMVVPLITLAIAGVTCWIARLAYRTSRAQYRMSLFDKRYEILDAARRLFNEVLLKADLRIGVNSSTKYFSKQSFSSRRTMRTGFLGQEEGCVR